MIKIVRSPEVNVLVFYLAFVIVWTHGAIFCQEPVFPAASESAEAARIFKIGYMLNDPEAQIGVEVVHELREFLLAQPPVMEAMKAEGVSEISLLAVDRHEVMVERMNRNEFDLAFCSAVDFVLQNGDYDARFQLRRPQDSFDSRNNRVFHKGVIFVNNRHPYFHQVPSPREIAETLTTTPIAMVAGSAAGYFYPGLKIAQLTPNQELPQQVHLCDSSEEVVKTVLNGLGGTIEVGACEKGAIEQVLARYNLLEHQGSLLRIILETDPIPGEPVVFHRQWTPRLSSLGRAIAEAMQRFFSEARGLPRLEFSSNEKFQDLRENIRQFWSLVGRKPVRR